MTNCWDNTSSNPRDDFERAKKIIKADTSWKPPNILLYPDQAELLGLERGLCWVSPSYLQELITHFLVLEALKRTLDE